MRHFAKFHQNPSSGCVDMATELFFQHGGRPPSWICFVHIWTTRDEHLMCCAKFGWNQCSSFDNTQVSIFCVIGLKSLFTHTYTPI